MKAGLHADADPAEPSVIVEGGDVVPSGFRKIDDLRDSRILAADDLAVDHPVHFSVGSSDLEARFGDLFARRTLYHSTVVESGDRDGVAGLIAGCAVRRPWRRQRLST